MRGWPLFPAPHLYLSDSARHSPTRAGTPGLRHKSRHKIPSTRLHVPELSSRAGARSSETPFAPSAHSVNFLLFFFRAACGASTRLPYLTLAPSHVEHAREDRCRMNIGNPTLAPKGQCEVLLMCIPSTHELPKHRRRISCHTGPPL
jgi:hypothetical protein